MAWLYAREKTKVQLSYSDCGVDIDAGNKFVSAIKPLAEQTHNKNVVSSIGGFGGLFDVSGLSFRNPVLVSSTDGVGTKVVLAERLNKLEGIGIDLVAMCANDIICCGATPLFFLDYYATGHLDLDQGAAIVKGIVEGCKQSGMALLGGETAEMRAVYGGNKFDLAGFAVGVVEKEKIISPANVRVGDCLIGIASSGPHANGYSMINRLAEKANNELVHSLLTPTKIYVKTILELIKQVDVGGIAHITGGGLTENIPRILPRGANAMINLGSWPVPPIFDWIQTAGNVSAPEMLRTFNNGIGMVVSVPPFEVGEALETLTEAGERSFLIGHIIKGFGDPAVFYRKV